MSKRGQVTIPKPLRDKLGLRAGQILEFRADGGKLVAAKVSTTDAVDEVYGILRLGQSTDELLDELRRRARSR